MNLDLRGRNFLVTAASQGLGYSVARELLMEGARVIISSSNPSRLSLAAESLKAEGLSQVSAVTADLKQANDIDHLMDEVFGTFEQLDGVVTNCGGPPAGPPLTITDAQWSEAFDSVFMSAVRLCRHAVPHMVKNGGGAILAITSTSVKQPISNLTTSNSLRPALAGYLKALSNEVAHENVRVNVVAPGRFLTDRTEELDSAMAKRTGRPKDDVRADYVSEIPMGRIADVSEFPALCAFLLSSKASYITGQVICNDGGRVSTIW